MHVLDRFMERLAFGRARIGHSSHNRRHPHTSSK